MRELWKEILAALSLLSLRTESEKRWTPWKTWIEKLSTDMDDSLSIVETRFQARCLAECYNAQKFMQIYHMKMPPPTLLLLLTLR